MRFTGKEFQADLAISHFQEELSCFLDKISIARLEIGCARSACCFYHGSHCKTK